MAGTHASPTERVHGGGRPRRVVIVGGGVAALELMLGLRKLGEELIETTLVAPDAEFRYRPASVAVPFERGEVFAFPLDAIAVEAGATFVHDRVVAVDPAARVVVTGDGSRIEYDALVIATGARRVPAVKGAMVFRGEEDIPAMRALLAEIERGEVSSLAFALPGGSSWALPLYELALLTSAHLTDHRIDGVSLTLVTPEDQPLAQFDGDTSRVIADLLAARGIRLITGSYAVGLYGKRLMLVPAETVDADRVVAMPAARGVAIDGLPHDFEGFLATDRYGRVAGVPGVYAIGDVTSQPIKQGGVAAQQADVLAQLLAWEAGAPVDQPEPHRPALRGLLLTGEQPRYLAADPTGGHGNSETISTEPLWWPGGKIAARRLGAYLVRAGHR